MLVVRELKGHGRQLMLRIADKQHHIRLRAAVWMDLIGKEQLMRLRLKLPQRKQSGCIRAQYGKHRIDARRCRPCSSALGWSAVEDDKVPGRLS